MIKATEGLLLLVLKVKWCQDVILKKPRHTLGLGGMVVMYTFTLTDFGFGNLT